MTLRRFVTAFFILTSICVIAADAWSAQDARKAAAQRQRRVLFNNDGDDAWTSTAPATPEGFLSVRMDNMEGCGVDSVFYCTTQSFNSFTHDSKISEVYTAKGSFSPNNRMAALLRAGTDPLALAIRASRARSREIFWTIRMNDIHDNYSPEMISQWKKDNPGFLVGSAADAKTYKSDDGRNVWTFVDFEHPEVRRRVVDIVRDVVNRYDVDGIDLDFMRHTCYFKETRLYEAVTADHMRMLTDMVSEISREVRAAGERKGKPVLLSTRIFPTLELNRRFGFDVEQWVSKGYVDFVAVGGGYDPFTMPVQDMIGRGRAWGIPVYVCLSASGMEQREVPDSAISWRNVEGWRAAAANAWAAGAAGLMTFNVFPNLPGTDETRFARSIWTEIGDPKGLAGKDKLYAIENLDISYTRGYMMRSVPWQDRLPAPVGRGATVRRVLPVADNIPTMKSRVAGLNLRVYLVGLKQGDDVGVRINDREVRMTPEKPGWIAGNVSADLMRRGANNVAVTYRKGTAAELIVKSVELTVRYRP